MPAVTKVQLRLGERVVAEVAFEGAELRIGRMKENDLVINNLAVSRFHAVLRRAGEAFLLEDLGSENGTFVDGVAVRGSVPVPAGVPIQVGKHTLVIRAAGAEAGAAAPAPRAATRPPLAPAPRSDVWDAAQTYFVGAPGSRATTQEEAVVEAEPDEDAGVEAAEAVEEPARHAKALPGARVGRCAAVELPDVEGALAFDEEELLAAAAPDAAAAASASVEPAELEPLASLEGAEALVEPPLGAGPGGQTALFDFGLTDDLGLSDRSLARAAERRARSAPAAPAPAPIHAGAAPAPLHAGLIVERLGRVERVVPWGPDGLVLGRAPDCDVVLAGSGVSRRHARFAREGELFRVSDLGSANGLRVNGRRAESATLAVGDVVAIDEFTLTFVLDREPVDAAVCAAPVEEVHGVLETEARAAIPERDLVLEEDESLVVDAEKELEESATASLERLRAPALEQAGWRFEVRLATERLPAALRRALAELGEDELCLPAELRLRRG